MTKGKKKKLAKGNSLPGSKRNDKRNDQRNDKQKSISDPILKYSLTHNVSEKQVSMAFISAGPAFEQSIEDTSPPSPHSSVSSEEIILFTGRNKPSRSISAPNHTNNFNDSTSQLHLSNKQDSDGVRSNHKHSLISQRTFSSSRALALSDDDIDEEMVADYIANMESSSAESELELNDENHLPNKGKQPVKLPREKGSVDSNQLFQVIAQQIAEAKISNSVPTAEKVSESIPYKITERQTIRKPPRESPVQPSSSRDSVKANAVQSAKIGRPITSILSQRPGNTGMFYLVVYDNQNDDTAEWIESDRLVNMTSTALQFFESPMWETEESESVDSEIQAEKDLQDMFNDELFEDHQLRKKQTRMTDEEIARRLAKQEEFGIDASEVVMFDGGESPGEPVQYLRQEAIRYSLRSRSILQHLESEESEFDLMDRERPSLQKPRKKSKNPRFGVIDSDMERDMLATWENDRAKKKKRKQEREELRAQGLLGGGAKAKYPNGMALDELKEEIKDFLASDRTTLSLPPMDKTERKWVHEIAHNFNVTSTSRGNGTNRHPVLTKKLRTRPFNEKAFESIADRLLKRYRFTGPAPRGGKEKKQFTYQEGDIVGSNAPELGSENRGRAMLEKMGWSKGDALGAVHNPGILDPIKHVVRSHRTGLG